MVVYYDPKSCLPSSAERPDSDDKPVDNELQNLIPNLLNGVLAMILARSSTGFWALIWGFTLIQDSLRSFPMGF